MSRVAFPDDSALLNRAAEIIVSEGLSFEAAAGKLDLSREWVRQLVEGKRPAAINRGTRQKVERFVANVAPRASTVRESSPGYAIDPISAAVGEFRAIQRIASDLAKFAGEASVRLERSAVSRPADPEVAKEVHATRRRAAEGKGAQRRG